MIPAGCVEEMTVSAVTVGMAVAVLDVVVMVVNLNSLLNGNNYLFVLTLQRGSINKRKKKKFFFSSLLFFLSLSVSLFTDTLTKYSIQLLIYESCCIVIFFVFCSIFFSLILLLSLSMLLCFFYLLCPKYLLIHKFLYIDDLYLYNMVEIGL